MANLLDEVDLQYAIRIDLPTGLFYCWTGRGDLELAGKTFIGGAGILSVDFEGQNHNPRLNFILADKRHNLALRKPVGAARVKMQVIGTLDNGATWKPLDFTLRGRLSRPTVHGLNYTVEVAPDVFLPTLRMWTQEDHQNQQDKPTDEDSYLTDSVFSQQRYLAEGKIQDDFGHIPSYEPSNYSRSDATTTDPDPGSGTTPTETPTGESNLVFLSQGISLARESRESLDVTPHKGGF